MNNYVNSELRSLVDAARLLRDMSIDKNASSYDDFENLTEFLYRKTDSFIGCCMRKRKETDERE